MSTEKQKRTTKKTVTTVETNIATSRWGLDLGRMDTQLVGEDNKRDIIPSRMSVDATDVFGNVAIINGRMCEITVDSPFSYNQNKNEDHSILLGHYLLAKNLNDGDVIEVGVGLPLDIYRNREERMAFALNFSNNSEPITVVENNVSKSFTINKVVVCPEGISATSRHKLTKITLVVDIGGRNVNIALVDKYGRPFIDSIRTFDEGMHDCLQKMSNNMRVELVNEKFMTTDNFLEIVLHGGGKKVIVDFMNRYFESYISDLFDKIDLIKEFDRSTMDMLFVGGTSVYLKDKIDAHVEKLNNDIEDKADHYNHIVSEDGKWDNPVAYLELLKATLDAQK